MNIKKFENYQSSDRVYILNDEDIIQGDDYYRNLQDTYVRRDKGDDLFLWSPVKGHIGEAHWGKTVREFQEEHFEEGDTYFPIYEFARGNMPKEKISTV